jgi:hypothetical protein
MHLDDYIVKIFCEIDDFVKKHFPARTLRARGPLPHLCDSEVLTMELVGEMLRLETDSAIFRFFKRHYSHFFPHLSDRTLFLRQAANLWLLKKRIFETFAPRYRDFVHVIDSFPLEVCRFQRARRCKLFRGLASYGKQLGNQTFYGFRLHLKINSLGLVHSFELAPANVADMHLVWELTERDSGLLLADRGYTSDSLQQELSQTQHLSVPSKI